MSDKRKKVQSLPARKDEFADLLRGVEINPSRAFSRSEIDRHKEQELARCKNALREIASFAAACRPREVGDGVQDIIHSHFGTVTPFEGQGGS